MTQQLSIKIDRAVKLIQSAGRDGHVVEIAYSGGKDSDVILELARMSGINFRAIYKNTTIDPPGTIAHAKENGAEILQPKKRFFEIIAAKGAPSRFTRFCCEYLKEYKVLDRVVIGVRKAESVRRAARYSEPTECRYYGNKKDYVQAFYPILEWSDSDIVEFIQDRQLRIHPLYYHEDGTIDPKRRLGCLCCPFMYYKNRLTEFRKYPGMAKQYIRAMQRFRDTHPNSKNVQLYSTVYEWAVREFFFDRQKDFDNWKSSMFAEEDYKRKLEDYFSITL